MLLFAIDALLVAACSLLIVAHLRLPTLPVVLVGAYCTAHAVVIGSALVGSALVVLSSQAYYLAVHAVLCGAAVVLWLRAKRPPLWGRTLHVDWRQWDIIASVRRNPVLWVLGAGVVIGQLIGVLVILWSPVVTSDSLFYHMSRVGYWLQHDSLRHWDTYNLRQTVFPINTEVVMMWTVAFTKDDVMARMVNWVALPAALVGIFGIGRLMGYTRREALFGALLFATFPIVHLQSVTTYNDLQIAVFFISAVYLLVLGVKTSQRGVLTLSGLALALAAGVKYTLLMASGGLVLIVLLLWLQHGRRTFRLLVWWAAAAAVFFLLFSSPNYVLSWRAHGHPLGPPEFRDPKQIPGDREISRLDLTIHNIARYSYEALDFAGIPRRISYPLYEHKAEWGMKFFDALGLNLRNLDHMRFRLDPYRRPMLEVGQTWYGPVGALLLLAVLPHTLWALYRRDLLRLGLALSVWAFLITLSAITLWTPFKGRYAIMVVGLIAPFAIPLYQLRGRWRVVLWGVVGLALVAMWGTAIVSARRPLIGPNAIRNRTDLEIMQHYSKRGPFLIIVEEHVPQDARIGLYFQEGDFDYPMFGAHFTRTVEQIYPYPDVIDGAWLAAHHYDYIAASNKIFTQDLPPELEVVDATEYYTLLRYRPDRAE